MAFSRALEDGHGEENLPDRYERGWEFRTDYHVLSRPIPRDRFKNAVEVPAIIGFALNRAGRVNQGYFFRFSFDGLAVLLSLVSRTEMLPEWLTAIADLTTLPDGDIELLLSEGHRYRQHLARERNPALAAEAKKVHGYACQVCGFDFEARFGARGRGYIEAHHRTPLHLLKAEPSLQLSPRDDFAVVCANCHRMLHRKPYLSVEELRDSLGWRA